MKLSICMMVKDEEKNLDRCLSSLQGLMEDVPSELIIIDTGSKDNTVQIAKKYTDKVYFHPWNNNFSEMRNISISYAKGEWVLIIDADEELVDYKDLITFLNTDISKKYNAGTLKLRNIMNDDNTANFNWVTRLYKNDNLKFYGVIHEHVDFVPKSYEINSTILHYGYVQSDKENMSKKYKRNITLLKKEIQTHPKDAMYRYYISGQYYMNKEYKNALEEILICYDLAKNQNYDHATLSFICAQIVFCCAENKMFDDAEKFCVEGLKLGNENIDLHYCYGDLLLEKKEYDEAIKHYDMYLNLIKNYDKLSITKTPICRFGMFDRVDNAILNISFAYLKQEDYNKALDYALKITSEIYLKNAFKILIECYIKTNQANRLKEYFEKNVKNKNSDIINAFTTYLEWFMQKYNKDKENNELEEYKLNIKKTIQQLVNVNQIEQASALAHEYLSIVKEDKEIDVIFNNKKSVE